MDFLGAQDPILWYENASEGRFDKTAFVQLKISNKLKQNIDNTHSKQQKIHRKIHNCLWILKISRKKSANLKSWDFCQMFVISKKKSIENLKPSRNGFLFFVISISGFYLAVSSNCAAHGAWFFLFPVGLAWAQLLGPVAPLPSIPSIWSRLGCRINELALT